MSPCPSPSPIHRRSRRRLKPSQTLEKRPPTAQTGLRAWGIYLLFGLLTALAAAAPGMSVHGMAARDTAAPGESIPGGTIPGTITYLPFVSDTGSADPPPEYTAIPVVGPPVDRSPEVNADLNLALRSYITSTAPAELININGPTDGDPPQLVGLFNTTRMPDFAATYRVYDWDWGCGPDGCQGAPIENPPATLLELVATEGEAVYIPTRNAEIYGGGFRAMVLYATPTRLTLTYTREDTPAIGYVVHLEDLAVEATLVSLYESLQAAGRGELPAIRHGERVGRVTGSSLKVVIRDTGSFMDPRSRKDWWQGYLHAR